MDTKLTIHKHEEFRGFYWLELEVFNADGTTHLKRCIADMLRKRDAINMEKASSVTLMALGHGVTA